MIAKEKWGFPQAQDPVVRLKIVILIEQNPSNRNFVGHADRWCGRGWQEYGPSVQSPFHFSHRVTTSRPEQLIPGDEIKFESSSKLVLHLLEYVDHECKKNV
jgi:hypothetical protein